MGSLKEIKAVFFLLDCNFFDGQAEIDKRKGMGVMLFHIEGTVEDLVIIIGPPFSSIHPPTRLTQRGHFYPRIVCIFLIYFYIFDGLILQVDACSGVDLILGVLGWSAGCSWASPSENGHFLEC